MQGIRLKSMRGRGGYVKDVKIENIEIHNVSNQAVQINMFYESSTVMPKTKAPSVCKDIEIRNVSGHGSRTAIQIQGPAGTAPRRDHPGQTRGSAVR